MDPVKCVVTPHTPPPRLDLVEGAVVDPTCDRCRKGGQGVGWGSMGPTCAQGHKIERLDLVVRMAMGPTCAKGSHNRRVGLGRQGGHGPNVYEG